MDALSTRKISLEFKSTSLSVPVLLPSDNVLSNIADQLQSKVAQAPEFFKNSPVLIDLQKLEAQNLSVSIEELVELLRQQHLMPIGLRGGNQQQIEEALRLNLPVFSTHGQNSPMIEPQKSHGAQPVAEVVTPEKAVDHVIENKLITQPIRSGQRVYARGDLIVTATVSAGAEIMAEGSIHVYGALRGRALAGVLGDTQSRIFCSDLQAELISIAGIYQLSDDLPRHTTPAKPVQISLDNQKLIIKDI